MSPGADPATVDSRVSSGVHSPSVASSDRTGEFGYDPSSAARSLDLVRSTIWRYFRPQTIGAAHIPSGRALVIGCHAGVIPYDAACTLVAIREATGRIGHGVGERWFGGVPGLESFLERQGAVLDRPDVVEDLLRHDELVLLMPGGSLDMARSYLTERYRVVPHRGWAPGRGGFVKLALRTRTPIVPLAVVGAEEVHLVLRNMPLVARLLRVPFAPLVASLFPLPARLYIRFGEPITLDAPPDAAADQRRVDLLTEKVRNVLQDLIDDTLAHRHGVIFSSYRSEQPGRPRRLERRGPRRQGAGRSR